MYGCESWAIKKGIDAFELWLEKTLESPLDGKEIQPVHSKGDQSWVFIIGLQPAYLHSWNSNTLATWCKELTHLKRPWCWERLRAGGEGDNRGWDGWMASPTQWTWIWVDSGSWWWTGRPGMLWFMGWQRVGHYWVTELNWMENRKRNRWPIKYFVAFKDMSWQPTPMLLPGKSHGRSCLVGYSPWRPKSGTQLSDFTFIFII